jgi:hypothetical protein
LLPAFDTLFSLQYTFSANLERKGEIPMTNMVCFIQVKSRNSGLFAMLWCSAP